MGGLNKMGIADKSTIVISTPTDLRFLLSNPVFDDDEEDEEEEEEEEEDDGNKRDYPYRGLNNENVLEKLIKGVEPKEEKLLLCYFDIYADQMVQLDKFTSLPKSIIQKIFKRKKLAIEEKKLFLALISWGKAECKRNDVNVTPNNIREIVDDELRYIRFPLMLLDDISEVVVPTSLLSQDELLMLYQYLGDETENKKSEIQVPWLCKPRVPRLAPKSFSFKFDENRKHSGVTVSKDGLTASSVSGNNWQSVFGNCLLPKKGCYSWNFKLNEYDTTNSWNVVLGVVPDTFTEFDLTRVCGHQSTAGWTFICGNSKTLYLSDPKSYTSSNTTIQKGETVGVQVDMDKGEISFIHNGKNLGVAFKNLPKGLRPSLTLISRQNVTVSFD